MSTLHKLVRSFLAVCVFTVWYAPVGSAQASGPLPPHMQNVIDKAKECKRYSRDNRSNTAIEADRVMLAKSENCQSACVTAYHKHKNKRGSQADTDTCLQAYNAFKSPGEHTSEENRYPATIEEMLPKMDAMGAEIKKLLENTRVQRRANPCLLSANSIRTESLDLAQATQMWGGCVNRYRSTLERYGP